MPNTKCLKPLDSRQELQPEHTAQQQLLGEVFTSRQQPAQQGQGHGMMEGGTGGWLWLQCCLRKKDGVSQCREGSRERTKQS